MEAVICPYGYPLWKCFKNMVEEEIALCYFCYIGVKHKNQSIFFGISLQSLSKRKQRLRAKLKIPRGMSFKDVVNAI